MIKKKAPRKAICITLDQDAINDMRKLSDSTRIRLSLLIDEAMFDLLKKYNKRTIKTTKNKIKYRGFIYE